MPELALFFNDPSEGNQFFLMRNEAGEAKTVICKRSNGDEDTSWSVTEFMADRGAANDKLRELLKAHDT